MIRSMWPQSEGGETLKEHALRFLSYGENSPFDGRQIEIGGDFILPPEETGDWAMKAARGIIAELEGRGGVYSEAFHPGFVDDESRVEIVDVIAEVMRQAYLFQK